MASNVVRDIASKRDVGNRDQPQAQAAYICCFRDPLIISKTVAVEALVAPNVRKMHELFARSAAVAALHRTPKSEMDERMKHEKTIPSCKFQILQ